MRGNSTAQNPSPKPKKTSSKSLENASRCLDGAGYSGGHMKRRLRRERPFSFVWVTHPPALPGAASSILSSLRQGREAAIFPLTPLVPTGPGLPTRAGRTPRRGARHQSRTAGLRLPPSDSRWPRSQAPPRRTCALGRTSPVAARGPQNPSISVQLLVRICKIISPKKRRRSCSSKILNG